MPSSRPAEAPLLRFTLADGRPATLLVGNASTVLSIDDALVSSWDLGGRPYALVRETGTYRRGLDGGLLWKREATAERPRLRQRLPAAEGEPIVEAARQGAAAALEALVISRDSGWTGPEESAVPADPSSPGPDGAPRGDKVIAMGDRPQPVRTRNGGGCSWTRTPFERRKPLRRTTSQAKTAERTRPTPVAPPRAS